MTFEYEDIVNLPHLISKTHKPMSMEMRAAQFAPFSALNGHSEALNEVARYTSNKPELTEEKLKFLSFKLNRILSTEKSPEIKIKYFKPDINKNGGEIVSIKGIIKKIDYDDKTIIFSDGTIILSDNILDIITKTID